MGAISNNKKELNFKIDKYQEAKKSSLQVRNDMTNQQQSLEFSQQRRKNCYN